MSECGQAKPLAALGLGRRRGGPGRSRARVGGRRGLECLVAARAAQAPNGARGHRFGQPHAGVGAAGVVVRAHEARGDLAGGSK